jgi:hypothetical protein
MIERSTRTARLIDDPLTRRASSPASCRWTGALDLRALNR